MNYIIVQKIINNYEFPYPGFIKQRVKTLPNILNC